MSKTLQLGDKVVCQFFNTPDNEFYGNTFVATIIGRDEKCAYQPARDFVVQDVDGHIHSLWRKEILRRKKCVI